MELKKQGIAIDCMNCHCAASDGCGGFDVAVPLTDGEIGTSGTAILHCTVTPACHHVELQEWNDTGFHSISPSAELRPRISAALDFVAEHRLCGNRRICPSEVIRIVEEHGV